MKSDSNNTNSVCFIGTGSQFSFSALQTLCDHNVVISGIFLSSHPPATRPAKCLPISIRPPATQENSIAALATKHNIPITYLRHTKNKRQQWREILSLDTNQRRPDFLFVACFPEMLPSVVLRWPHKYSINLHPSLLPKYRGPDPIFWQQHYKEKNTGISLHILTEQLDAGPLVTQRKVAFPASATRNELDILLAQQGARAFVKTLHEDSFIGTAQDETQASYHPWPNENNREFTDKSH